MFRGMAFLVQLTRNGVDNPKNYERQEGLYRTGPKMPESFADRLKLQRPRKSARVPARRRDGFWRHRTHAVFRVRSSLDHLEVANQMPANLVSNELT